MSLYLPPKAGNTFAIAICDRCSFKYYLSELTADSDSPGLRVCRKCSDQKDPYKLPAKKPDKINLRHPRPDVPLEIPEE